MFYLKKDFNYLELATPKKEKKKNAIKDFSLYLQIHRL